MKSLTLLTALTFLAVTLTACEKTIHEAKAPVTPPALASAR